MTKTHVSPTDAHNALVKYSKALWTMMLKNSQSQSMKTLQMQSNM